jgi:hypothetical protein
VRSAPHGPLPTGPLSQIASLAPPCQPGIFTAQASANELRRPEVLAFPTVLFLHANATSLDAAVELPEPARADVEQLVAWVERMRDGERPDEGGVPHHLDRESAQPDKKDEL